MSAPDAFAPDSTPRSDRAYIAQCHAQGLYALGYVPHNHHFLWFGKAMTGESQDCLASAHHVRQHVATEKMREPGFGALQHYHTLPIWTYVRFGMWDRALSDEPPTWCIPSRQLLGAVLLDAGKAAEAEAVYREELTKYPDNGWSLFGLHQALEGQGEHRAAAEAKRRYEQAWAHADVTLLSSREVAAAADGRGTGPRPVLKKN